jgi:hypothetical protein
MALLALGLLRASIFPCRVLTEDRPGCVAEVIWVISMIEHPALHVINRHYVEYLSERKSVFLRLPKRLLAKERITGLV